MKKLFIPSIIFFLTFLSLTKNCIAQSQQIYLSCSAIKLRHYTQSYNSTIQTTSSQYFISSLSYSKFNNKYYWITNAEYSHNYSNQTIPFQNRHSYQDIFKLKNAAIQLSIGKYFHWERFTVKTGGLFSSTLYFQYLHTLSNNNFFGGNYVGYNTNITNVSPYPSFGIYHTLDLQCALTKNIFIGAGIKNGIELKLKTDKQITTTNNYDTADNLISSSESIASEKTTELATNFLVFNVAIGYNFIPKSTQPKSVTNPIQPK